MEDIKVLIRKRGHVKARVSNFEKYLKNQLINVNGEGDVPTASYIELDKRIANFETLLSDFMNVQQQIESVSDDPEIVKIEESEAFENRFFELLGKAGSLCKEKQCFTSQSLSGSNNELNEAANDSQSIHSVHSDSNYHIKLPTINLPKFNGDLSNWLEFRDTFLSLIHEQQSLNDIQKFHYLRASLEGEAKQIIQSMEVSSANYEVAWISIYERYDNKRLLVNKHIQSIFNLPHVNKENSVQLREISDNLSKHLRSLSTLKQTTEQLYNSIIIHIVVNKFDSRTARDWEGFKCDDDLPTLNNLQSFLKEKCVILESLNLNKLESSSLQKGKRSQCLVGNNISCFYCKEPHAIYNCKKFSKLSVSDRIADIKKNKRCINCFRLGHFANNCTFGHCRKCKARHNTLLHNDPSTNQECSSPDESSSKQFSMSSQATTTQVLLATVSILLIDSQGTMHPCRALLDSGSQSNLISNGLVTRLKLPRRNTNISLVGIGQTSQSLNSICDIQLKARCNNFSITIPCLVIGKICDPIPNSTITQDIAFPTHLPLADPSFNKPGKIDLLLGAQCFWNLMCVGQVRLKPNNLVLQKTKFGWVLSGPLNKQPIRESFCHLSLNIEIQNQLERFWQIESYDESNPVVHECEQHFQKTTSRDAQGRFVVSLPLKESVDVLGQSYTQAEKRFLSLENRLRCNPVMQSKYIHFMKEYEALGHMTEVKDDCSEKGYYLPHHGVTNEGSLTTKLRVVFDGSAATSSGYSLNNILHVGPTVQNELFTILLRFRKHNFAVCADIEKMYRQVSIRVDERYLQKILWREQPIDTLKTFELNTVTYGTAPAPFLAIRSLHEVGNICREKMPQIADIIQKDFYVDDMLTGSDNLKVAIHNCQQVSSMLNTACFSLRKWVSNSPELLNALNQKSLSSDIHNLSSRENAKTLGLTWSCHTDEFLYDTNIMRMPAIVTKRTMLSTISQMFDPMGLLSPITIRAKIMLQKLWLEKVSWDETLSFELQTSWQQFCNDFASVARFKIPRHVICNNYIPTKIHLHGFSDASEQAYGACLYIVSSNENNTISHLLCAKTRVAPLKPITIPRLELCAALLLSKLLTKVINSLEIKFTSYTLWTDSSIVLAWIKTSPMSLKTFVRNRINDIQTLTHMCQWRHVRSEHNPADYLSRGIDPITLQNLSVWWNGPKWITQPERCWPLSSPKVLQSHTLPDVRNISITCVSIQNTCPIQFERFSSLNRLIRSFAYCLRFIENCKAKRDSRKLDHLSVTELKNSHTKLIQFVQSECFKDDLHLLKSRSCLKSSSKILSLNPFLDKNGILRVGGRLSNSSFEFNKKHPILMPKGHYFSKLLMFNEHIRLGHAGPELLLSSIRDEYWPICGRNMAREIYRKCVRCFKVNPQSNMPIMGNLPDARVKQSPPFSNVGIDYAGPVMLRDRPGRGSKTSKAYIAVFVCFATRAIHLELVTELTTEAFMATFRRFIARRGKPLHVYSDNGTNFVGARNELQELGKFISHNQIDICSNAAMDGISWNFIPPRSPHFGGIWEAGVKSTKSHLKRIIGNANLTFECMYTTLTQIEAILNSRPLSPLSNNPTDYEPLTPAHFLVGRKLTTLPEINIEDVTCSRLSRYQRSQQLSQHFWRRWSREFISELQQRRRWKSSSSNITPGAMVVIKEDNLPPLCWALGRITDTHPGKDGKVRVVSVRTVRGVFKRAVSRICVMPIDGISQL